MTKDEMEALLIRAAALLREAAEECYDCPASRMLALADEIREAIVHSK